MPCGCSNLVRIFCDKLPRLRKSDSRQRLKMLDILSRNRKPWKGISGIQMFWVCNYGCGESDFATTICRYVFLSNTSQRIRDRYRMP